MAITITKIYLEGNNVVLKDDSDNVLHVLASNGTYANGDDCLENIIHISNKPADKEPIDWNISIDARLITVPSGAWTQSTLLQELSDNYLNQSYSIWDLIFGKITELYNFFTTEGNIRLADSEDHNRINAQTTGILLLDVNTNRRESTITNDSPHTMYVKKGAGITVTNWSYKLRRGDSVNIDDYRGQLWGVWDGSTGSSQNLETF